MDQNQDGVVTLDEFIECCRNDDAISRSINVFDSTFWPGPANVTKSTVGRSDILSSATLVSPIEASVSSQALVSLSSNHPLHHYHQPPSQQQIHHMPPFAQTFRGNTNSAGSHCSNSSNSYQTCSTLFHPSSHPSSMSGWPQHEIGLSSNYQQHQQQQQQESPQYYQTTQQQHNQQQQQRPSSSYPPPSTISNNNDVLTGETPSLVVVRTWYTHPDDTKQGGWTFCALD